QEKASPRWGVEQLAHRVPRQPRRTLAQRREDRRVRPRHTAHGLGAGQEQIQEHQRLRGPPRRAHHPAGSWRRSLFQRLESEGVEMTHRRDFLKSATATGLGAVLANRAPLILTGGSPNERIVVAVVGVNGRGIVHVQNFGQQMKDAEVAYVCDVDSNALAKGMKALAADERAPKAIGDFRRALDDKNVDAVSIAAPDHWHTPMAILAMKAGKHVYLEKPTGHNPREAELLAAAQKKTERVVQVGTQQRSSPRTIEALQMIRDGVIGSPYLVRAWYANTRVGIGKGKVVPVPENLNYELWQGPAPRTPYHDNYIHYNWHWFRRWGTGEIHNNGTHEIDIARLTLGVDLPTRVSSSGGRYHYADDWE